MKKLKRILTGLLAVVLVISNLQLGTITVNAAEVDDTIVTTGEGEEGDVTPTATPEATPETTPEATPEAGNVVFCDFTDWSTIEGKGWSSSNTVENGVNTIVYEEQYGEIYYAFPENVDAAKVTKVELVVEEGEGIALKLYNNADGTSEQKPAEYDAVEEATYRVAAFGIMNMVNGENTVVISGVKFTLGEEDVPVKPEATPAPLEPLPTEKITYKFADDALTIENNGGATVEKSDDGAITIKHTSKWQSVFIQIPEALKEREIQRITFNTTDGTGSFAFKVFDAKLFEADEEKAEGEDKYRYGAGVTGDACYGNPVQIVPEGSQIGLGYLAVMSNSDDLPNITITSIDFECTKTEYCYTFAGEDALIITDDSGATVELGEDGVATITHTSKWQSVFIAVPEELVGRAIEKVTFNTTDDASAFGFKVFATDSDIYGDGVTGTAAYGNNVQNVPNNYANKVNLLAVMSNSDSLPTIKISSITFKVKNYVPPTTIEENLVGWKTAITDAFGEDAVAGTCLGYGTITYDYLQALAKKHFNAITFENEMKPDATLGGTPTIGEDGYPVLNFSKADEMMAQIKAWNDESDEDDIDFKIRGHVLVWHSQTPEWFFHEDYDVNKPFLSGEEGRAEMNLRLENYIADVFEHYKGVQYDDGSTAADLFYGWDVVNEAMSDSTGAPRKASDNSNWAKVYGDESNEYIINAFRYANEHAPAHIELYYNDYNDCNEPKASGIAALVAEITSHENDAENPTRIDGVGMQAHHNYLDPTKGQIIAAAVKYLEALGGSGNVQMTELDVKASSTFNKAELEKEHDKQGWRFKEIFEAYKEIEANYPGRVGGITMWGITDETSWLQSQNSAGGGATGNSGCAPLLFYVDNYVAKAKPAYYAFVDPSQLKPMIQDVTIVQQMAENDFSNGIVYNILGESEVNVGTFVPMWTEEGLAIKVTVNDDTDNGAADKFTVYVDEEGKRATGDYAKVTVSRGDEVVEEIEGGYTAIVKIPATTAVVKSVCLDVAVENNGTINVFNDKKKTQASTSEFYAEAIMKPYATIKKGTAVIDGKMDALWLGADEIPMTINVGSAEATGYAKFMWDEEYLYAYYDVKDANLDKTSGQAHEQDSIEVFIDENNNKTDGYESDTHQYRVNYLNEQTFGNNSNPENIQSATRIIDGGYVLETAFKWTEITPVAGDKVGLEFQINDGKGGTRIGTMSWYDTSGQGYQSPRVFGTVTLLADEVVAPEGLDEMLGDLEMEDIPIGSDPADIPENIWVMGVKDGKLTDTFYYTGQQIKPELKVYDGNKKLVLGTDYTIKYTNNVKAAAATAKKAPAITITGKGNYSSKVTVKFDIKKVDLNSNSIAIDDTIVANFTNKVQKPVPTVLFNGKKLKKNTDFTVTYPTKGTGVYKAGNTEEGETPYAIVVKGKGNFEGEFTVNFLIDDEPYDISEKDVAAEEKKIEVTYELTKVDDTYTTKYEKGGVKPGVVVSYDNNILVEGKDYTVKYTNVAKAAAATAGKKAPTITIKGIGFYKGTITQKFTIEKQDISVATMTTTDIAFNPKGGVNKTTVKLVDVNGNALKAKTDYNKTFTYTYKNDTTLVDGTVKTAGSVVGKKDVVPAGTVLNVTVKGAGNYDANSTIVGEYEVVPASIAKAKIKIKDQGYTGSAITLDYKAVTSAKIGKNTLSEADYEFVDGSYLNNTEKTTKKVKASVTVRGTGNYTGEVKATFVIKTKGFSLTNFFANLF